MYISDYINPVNVFDLSQQNLIRENFTYRNSSENCDVLIAILATLHRHNLKNKKKTNKKTPQRNKKKSFFSRQLR